MVDMGILSIDSCLLKHGLKERIAQKCTRVAASFVSRTKILSCQVPVHYSSLRNVSAKRTVSFLNEHVIIEIYSSVHCTL